MENGLEEGWVGVVVEAQVLHDGVPVKIVQHMVVQVELALLGVGHEGGFFGGGAAAQVEYGSGLVAEGGWVVVVVVVGNGRGGDGNGAGYVVGGFRVWGTMGMVVVVVGLWG